MQDSSESEPSHYRNRGETEPNPNEHSPEPNQEPRYKPYSFVLSCFQTVLRRLSFKGVLIALRAAEAVPSASLSPR